MTRKHTKTPKTFAATMLPNDVHRQLRWLATDLGTSVAGLLRLGALLVLQECGDELPESVAHLRRVAFAGEVPEYADEIEPESVRIPLEDEVYAALEKHVGKDYIARFIGDLVNANIPPADPGPTRSRLN